MSQQNAPFAQYSLLFDRPTVLALIANLYVHAPDPLLLGLVFKIPYPHPLLPSHIRLIFLSFFLDNTSSVRLCRSTIAHVSISVYPDREERNKHPTPMYN